MSLRVGDKLLVNSPRNFMSKDEIHLGKPGPRPGAAGRPPVRGRGA
jgi:hypothetical protein